MLLSCLSSQGSKCPSKVKIWDVLDLKALTQVTVHGAMERMDEIYIRFTIYWKSQIPIFLSCSVQFITRWIWNFTAAEKLCFPFHGRLQILTAGRNHYLFIFVRLTENIFNGFLMQLYFPISTINWAQAHNNFTQQGDDNFKDLIIKYSICRLQLLYIT